MGCGASSPTDRELDRNEASNPRLANTRKDVSMSRVPNVSTNRLASTPTTGNGNVAAERDGGEGTQPNPLVATSTAREASMALTPGKSAVLGVSVTPRDAAAPTAAVAASQVLPTPPVVTSSSSAPPPPSANNQVFPSYTITDSRGCRVVTMIQNRVKVETMCKWLDNVLRSRDEAGGVFRNIDAQRENPLLRDDVGRETSSVSSRAGHSRASEQSMTVFLNVSTTHDMQSRTIVGTTAAQGGSQVDEQVASRVGPTEEE